MKYFHKLQPQLINTTKTKQYPTIRHCFSDNCQLPAKANGNNRNGNLMIDMFSHVCVLLHHKPDMKGIKKRKPMPSNKGDLKKEMICERIF